MSDHDRDEEFVANRFELLDQVPAPDTWSSVVAHSSRTRRRPHRFVMVTCAAVLVALVFALGWLVGRHNVAIAPTSPGQPETPAASVDPTTPAVPTDTQPGAVPTSAPEPADETVPAPPTTVDTVTDPTTPSTAQPEPTPVVRPYVDPSICEMTVARGPFEASFVEEVLPFAMSQESPRSMQVIGDPAAGYSGGFVLVQRFFTTEFNRYDGAYGGDTLADPDGKITNGHTSPNGYGDAYVLFPDGTEAYFRARGLDDAALEQVIAATEPRTGDRAATGFDYDPEVGPDGFELLYEGDNRDLRSYGGGRSECRTPTEPSWLYRIDSFDADPILEAVWILDRPVPIEVAERDGVLISIDGPDEPGRPSVDDVTNAPPDVWSELLNRRTATEDAYYEADVVAFPEASARIRSAIEQAGFEVSEADEIDPRSESYTITNVDSGDDFHVIASHQLPEVLGEHAEFESDLNGAPGVHLIRRDDGVAAWAWCSGPTIELSAHPTSADSDIEDLLQNLNLILRELECADPELLQPA